MDIVHDLRAPLDQKHVIPKPAGIGRPSQKIRGFLAKLQTYRYYSRVQKDISIYLKELQQKLPKAKYPGAESDKLYQPSYLHKHHQPLMPCDECVKDEAQKPRQADHPEQHEPVVHFGRMGSGDTVMKWAEDPMA